MKNILFFLSLILCTHSFFAADGRRARSTAHDFGRRHIPLEEDSEDDSASEAVSGGGVLRRAAQISIASKAVKSVKQHTLFYMYRDEGLAVIREKIASGEWNMDNTLVEHVGGYAVSAVPLCYALRMLAAQTGNKDLLEIAPVRDKLRYSVPSNISKLLFFRSDMKPTEDQLATKEFADLYNEWMTRKEIQRAVIHGQWKYLQDNFTQSELAYLPECWEGAQTLYTKYNIQDAEVIIRSHISFAKNEVDDLRCLCLLSSDAAVCAMANWTDEQILRQKERINRRREFECLSRK